MVGTLVVLGLVAVAAWVGWKLFKKPDQNNDGKVDGQDALVAAKEVVAEVKVEAAKVADLNKDGKVDVADAKVAGAAAVAAAGAAVEKVKKGRKKKAV